MATAARSRRRDELGAYKRERILAAAREVFAEHGLDRATLRQIAAAAGYVAGTLYLHFESKEAIYGALLASSLDRLAAAVDAARGSGAESAFMAFHRYYADNAEELDLGLYLFRGTGRRGLSPGLDQELNDRLRTIVESLASTLAAATGLPWRDAHRETVSLASFMVGCLIMGGTGRLGMLGYAGDDLVRRRLAEVLGSGAGDGSRNRVRRHDDKGAGEA
jgi:AcrR family transcriptional regulator